MTTDRIWILGAADPEMEAIERLLRECGETVVYAADARGERVTPGTAYRGESLVTDVGNHPCTSGVTDVYLVECDLLTPDVSFAPEEDICHPELAGRTVRRIDHHRPGDPGYGRPPEDFMAASSIGQVISELAKTGALRRAIPKEHEIVQWMASHRDLPVAEYNEMLRTQWFWVRRGMPGPDPYPSDGTIARGVSWIYDGYAVAVRQNDLYFEWRVALIPPPLICAAAADHCLAAAYRGECPGVDPDALMRWRAKTRAAFQGRPVEDVLADVERARVALSEAPLVELSAPLVGAHEVVHDLRERHVPELPEAASRDGVAYLATVVERDGRRKVVLGGHTTPELVREFMEEWAPAHGFVDIYGDPARGFAGAYMPEAG